MVLVIYQP